MTESDTFYHRLVAVLTLLSVPLLYFRFDWIEGANEFSLRSFWLSTCLLLIVVPTLGVFLQMILKNWRYSVALLILITLALCLPYHAIGITLNSYNPFLEDWRSQTLSRPTTDWFPLALRHGPTIPNEGLCFAGFILVIVLLYEFFGMRVKALKKYRGLALAVLILVCFQTWAHLSLRSPYTYVPHYEQPAQAAYWYHYYLFPNAKGAVNLDFHVFRPGEEVFMGVKRNLAPLCTRAFPSYIASHFSRFFNSYYVWLWQNMLFWLLAVLSIFLLAQRYFKNCHSTDLHHRAAIFSAILMASNQSVILYVAQPKVYANAICMLALVLVTQEYLFTRNKWKVSELIAYTGLLSFFFLSYEAQPWILGFITLTFVSRWNLRVSLGCIVAALAFYYGFLFLCSHLPHISVGETQTTIAGDPVANIKALLYSGNVFRILKKGLICFRGFGRCLVHCFQLTIIPAILGLWLCPKPQRVRLLCLLLAPLLTYSFFELGENWYYTQFPRLVMLAYPAIYLLGGFALAVIWETQFRKGPRSLGKALSFGFILLNIVYLNLDVWGHPWIYYLWFYRHPGFSLAH